ncbi:MAG TPA: alpha/beta hydrolase [Candidatus Acidoferrales bacterium]|nr:alpha/beta hydrolase [Candidatus Acidoferrales bacterium]
MRRRFISVAGFFVIAAMVVTLHPSAALAKQRWQQLPPMPRLPFTQHQGYAPVNGIRMFYAVYGSGKPVILLHGGLANANYWGNQIPALSREFEVIVADSRGHGRSTRTPAPYGYDLMASDVVALMDYLHISKAAIVGWSDGGILALDLAMHHPDRLTRVFAFAANYNPSGVKEDVLQNPTFAGFVKRAGSEYKQLSATPNEYSAFVAQITKMWDTQPNWTKDQLRSIRVPVLIVDGDHDEAIKREQTEEMAALIPGAGLLIQPHVSHFSFLQDPDQFSEDVLRFLNQR